MQEDDILTQKTCLEVPATFNIQVFVNFQATARGFLVILALSIHDLFEGVALGVARRESSVWFLLLAFASHKWVIAGCLGLSWARSPVGVLTII